MEEQNNIYASQGETRGVDSRGQEEREENLQGADRRENPRYPVEEACALIFAGSAKALPCSILNLSQEGCRVRTVSRIAMRSGWPVEVSFKVGGVGFRLSGVLQWSNGGELVGIRFVNVVPWRMVDLAVVLCEMEAAAARTKAVDIALAKLPEVGGRQSEEQNGSANRSLSEGALEEAPTKKAPMRAAGEQSASAAKGEPELDEAGSSRRATTRYDVDNLAMIFLINVGSKLQGRIVDLSVTGCRIRTDDRFPVGIYTRVETEFHLEGLPFRLGGVVQAIHDKQTVGIRFLDLSERKKQQVTELIAELSEMSAVGMKAGGVPEQKSA